MLENRSDELFPRPLWKCCGVLKQPFVLSIQRNEKRSDNCAFLETLYTSFPKLPNMFWVVKHDVAGILFVRWQELISTWVRFKLLFLSCSNVMRCQWFVVCIRVRCFELWFTTRLQVATMTIRTQAGIQLVSVWLGLRRRAAFMWPWNTFRLACMVQPARDRTVHVSKPELGGFLVSMRVRIHVHWLVFPQLMPVTHLALWALCCVSWATVCGVWWATVWWP